MEYLGGACTALSHISNAKWIRTEGSLIIDNYNNICESLRKSVLEGIQTANKDGKLSLANYNMLIKMLKDIKVIADTSLYSVDSVTRNVWSVYDFYIQTYKGIILKYTSMLQMIALYRAENKNYDVNRTIDLEGGEHKTPKKARTIDLEGGEPKTPKKANPFETPPLSAGVYSPAAPKHRQFYTPSRYVF